MSGNLWSNGSIVFPTTTKTTTKTTPKDRSDDNNNNERIGPSVHLFTKQRTSAQRALFLFRITTILTAWREIIQTVLRGWLNSALDQAQSPSLSYSPKSRQISISSVCIKTLSIVVERGPATYSPLLLHSYATYAYADTSLLYPFLSAFCNTESILYHY